MGFKKSIAMKFIESSGLSKNVHIAINSAKAFDEKMGYLSNITEQIAKITIEQFSDIKSTNSMAEELSNSIDSVTKNVEQLTKVIEYSNSSIGEIATSVQQVSGNAEITASAVEEYRLRLKRWGNL
ncbi:methyl-accepting chemotaxis sensory transducer [Thermoanaerobacter ethanolicus JW 200]|nr:methyl-accepting chemotaxis sensory transducer [Thermoanaerobacter ethanolicus JW 200]